MAVRQTVTENEQRIPTADGGYTTSRSTTTTKDEDKELQTQSGYTTRDAIEKYYIGLKEPVKAQITQELDSNKAILDQLQKNKEQADAENYRSYVRQSYELPEIMRASGNHGGMVDSAVASLANAYNQARARRGMEYETNVANQVTDSNNRTALLRSQLAQYDQLANADLAALDAHNAWLEEQKKNNNNNTTQPVETPTTGTSTPNPGGIASKAIKGTGISLDDDSDWAKRDISDQDTTPQKKVITPQKTSQQVKNVTPNLPSTNATNSKNVTNQIGAYEKGGTATTSGKPNLPAKSNQDKSKNTGFTTRVLPSVI